MFWNYLAAGVDWVQGLGQETWNWFNSLTPQEWFLVLGIIASLGFLCMRGYGRRGNL